MQQELENSLVQYIYACKNADVESTVNLLYDGIYKLISKEKLIDSLKKTFSNDSILDFMKDFSIHKISSIFEIDHIYFAKVEYYLEMEIDRNEDILTKIADDAIIDYDEHDKEMKNQIEFMLTMLKAVYGEEHVKFDTDLDCFLIWQLNTMLAINENGKWKFIRWLPGSVYQRIFPKKIVKKLATRFFLMD
jgi:hypothetical protein